jgi:hypothetical protein
MADMPGQGASFDGDPEHTTDSGWDALQGDMGQVYEQPAGCWVSGEAIPETAGGTSEPERTAWDTEFRAPLASGTPGRSANAREDNQSNVF